MATLVSFTLFPLALLLFASGFFPYKPFIPGLATFEEVENGSRPSPIFDRVIFMVVDALRSDFVYGNHSGFQFTQGLIKSGAAVPFTAHASSPTITMPRVKAITTGSVPSFVDVILNFAESDTTSTLAHQDTWLAQLKAKPGGRLVMYGDDTWLKLFPDIFYRHDGTTSFFVSDFTEVDNNVTRHIPEEMGNADWNAMIMHYLGLDHIGHKAGPRSPHMIPKQKEMDSIVKQIYSSMEKEPHLSSALLVLCGDHGMNDGGNHGGASAGETSPALTFISPKFQGMGLERAPLKSSSGEFDYYDTIDQSDIAPTLGGLLGFPIPLNNLGVFIPQFLPLWKKDRERLQLLQENAKQMINIVKQTYPSYKFDSTTQLSSCDGGSNSEIADLECKWHKAQQMISQTTDDTNVSPAIESSLIAFLRTAQTIMSSTASNYNLARLYQGIAFSGISFLLSLYACVQKGRNGTAAVGYIFLVLSGYGALMFASSYVEEEQHFWYWMTSGWIFYLYWKSSNRQERKSAYASAFILAALTRVMRRWNQTGQKFAGEPDIANTFFREHPNVLWLLILFTYTDLYQRLLPNTSIADPTSKLLSLLYLPLTSFSFIFKVVFTDADAPELIRNTPFLPFLIKGVRGLSLVFQARVVLIGVLVCSMYTMYLRATRNGNRTGARRDVRGTFHSLLSLLLITQSRATNIPLFAFFRIQQQVLSSMSLSTTEITVTSLLFQYASFFALGGSNAISSVDLSNAYNGVSGYNVGVVGILTFISNWAGPIWWVSATHHLLSITRSARRNQSNKHIQLLTLFVATSLLAVMVACTALRTHLFIWTVFSPKFLYSMAWTLAQHIIINILFGEYMLRWLYN
ncbi:GPI ethanolamine phosphate transferase 2 [Nannizzia gypsea CBS 118893]|uniref:GPI ethanolamine phosphate transferase 2 n=1 Tax=Arthroderma gypseum (strain ATCC MYA-4604 / CBS 118893) TaxID=535722 RepID=E4UYY0_ARTGP|nr:GPI ethanolamine phosphate transferase 2 [Nannizzia gypsea CBS 118893]EFR03310.1 GPI ethanolamine phosphate transferase 2 [Nannizzia gypsea CBS 118893]